ncbi:MAG: helix-turn-helix domain-containing protein [Dolichospermum sp.]
MNQIKDRRDFAIVVPSYLDDYGLSPYEYRLYSHIVRRAGKNGCFESIPNIAKHCLMNEKTVRQSLKVLLGAGMIAVVESKKGKSVVYEVTPHEDWVTPEELPNIRNKRTPTKSGTTTPTKSGTTPLPNLADEVFPSKEIPFKEIPLSEREEPPTPEVEVLIPKPINPEIQESALEQIAFPGNQKSKSSLPTDNPSLEQKSPAPLANAETTADRVRRTYQETGNLPRIPAELEAWVQIDLGSEIVASYRKSGRVTTIKQGDIQPDFARYVAAQNKGKDIDYGYSYVRSLEKDPTKWETLAALVIKWQASKTTNNHNLNITQEVERASKPRIDFGGIRL